MASILLGVCAYPTLPHIYPATQAALDVLCAQSPHAVTVAVLADDDPALDHYANLERKHNDLRRMTLDGDHDALLLVEADMIPPPDTVARLWAVDADVAYGLYCARTSGMWLLMTEVDGRRGVSISAEPAAARAAWGKVTPSRGAGFGCTLIHRRVLEQVAFRRDETPPLHHFADDWWFAQDVAAAGLRQAHECGVVCGHIRRDGDVVWPDPTRADLVRIERRQAQEARVMQIGEYRVVRTLWLGGQNRYAHRGETVMLDEESAGVLGGRGFVAPVASTPAVAETAADELAVQVEAMAETARPKRRVAQQAQAEE